MRARCNGRSTNLRKRNGCDQNAELDGNGVGIFRVSRVPDCTAQHNKDRCGQELRTHRLEGVQLLVGARHTCVIAEQLGGSDQLEQNRKKSAYCTLGPELKI